MKGSELITEVQSRRQCDTADNRDGDNLVLIRSKWRGRNRRKEEPIKVDKANLIWSE